MIGYITAFGERYFGPHYFGRRYWAFPTPIGDHNKVLVPTVLRAVTVEQRDRSQANESLGRAVAVVEQVRAVTVAAATRIVTATGADREVD